MRKLFSALLIACFCVPSFSLAAPPILIGLETPPYPTGYEDMGGGMFFNEHPNNHAYNHLCYGQMITPAPHLTPRCKGQDVVVLQRFVERRGRKAYFKVIDEVRLPVIPSNREVLSIPLCSSASHKNDTVLAIGRWENVKDGYTSKDISHAWRFNLQAGKTEPISTHDVVCEGDAP